MRSHQMSDVDTKKTIDGVEYDFQLLKLRDATKIEMRVIGLITALQSGGQVDEDALYEIGSKLCAGMTADDAEVASIDAYFAGKTLLFNRVVVAALEINFPDFFSALGIDVSDSFAALAKQIA